MNIPNVINIRKKGLIAPQNQIPLDKQMSIQWPNQAQFVYVIGREAHVYGSFFFIKETEVVLIVLREAMDGAKRNTIDVICKKEKEKKFCVANPTNNDEFLVEVCFSTSWLFNEFCVLFHVLSFWTYCACFLVNKYRSANMRCGWKKLLLNSFINNLGWIQVLMVEIVGLLSYHVCISSFSTSKCGRKTTWNLYSVHIIMAQV